MSKDTNNDWRDDDWFRSKMRPHTLKEIRGYYELGEKAMNNMLKKIEDLLGKPAGRYYNVKQVEIIFTELGVPYSLRRGGPGRSKGNPAPAK